MIERLVEIALSSSGIAAVTAAKVVLSDGAGEPRPVEDDPVAPSVLAFTIEVADGPDQQQVVQERLRESCLSDRRRRDRGRRARASS